MSEAICGYRGCQNQTAGEWPHQMCDPCYQEALGVEDSEMLCECGYEPDTFACKIRHQHMDLSWTKGIH